MRTIFFILMLISLNVYCENDNEIEVNSKITSANVFINGAQVSRKATVNIKAGSNVYVIKGITPFMVANTIQVSGTGNFTIIGVNSRTNYIDKIPTSPKLKKMQDSILIYNKWIENKTQMKDVYTQEKDMILQNKVLKGNNTNLNPDDLAKLADFYRTRLKDINFKILDITRLNSKYQTRITTLNQQINEFNKTFQRNTSEILVNISSKAALQGKLIITYQVNNAGWVPSYDIRSTNKSNNISLTYKGNIYQTTGNDWNNVKITLSTGNLNLSNQKPVLSPWYIQYYNAYNNRKYGTGRPAMKEQAVSSALEMNDAVKTSSNSTIADFTQTIQNMVNTEFVISMPLSIKNGGNGKLIEVTKNNLPAEYRYLAIPKIDKNAFLIARITGWEELYLLPGEISLYNNDSYVGKSYLDPNATLDTMEVSLGRDQFITFERKMIKDYNKNVLIGSQRKVQRGYDIKIRNNKNEGIDLLVMDQIPLSTLSEIEVKLLDDSGASFEENTGFLTWKMNLKPQEKKKVNFKFSVKYPKDKVISNL